MIYFDNASTTTSTTSPHSFYNPSSPHSLGIKAERALRDARAELISFFNSAALSSSSALSSAPGDVIFTSGGTESNNLAILGYALTNIRRGSTLISAYYEHPSLLSPIEFACERQWSKKASSNSIPPGNVLLSISHVNHETGDINDINNIAHEAKKINPGAIILVDGVQGFCKEELCLDLIDMYSFSGHKMHGPFGVGGLWIRKGVNLTPLQHGGGQENALRSGTENVSGIIQMVEAFEILNSQFDKNYALVANIKKILLGLRDVLQDITINSLNANTSPYILNMSFLGVKGETLVHALSEKGLYASMGAACRNRKRTKSGLELMGFSPEIAESAIRLSFSPYNTVEEAEQARDIIISEVQRFRKLKG